MSIFKDILNKLLHRGQAAQPQTTSTASAGAAPGTTAGTSSGTSTGSAGGTAGGTASGTGGAQAAPGTGPSGASPSAGGAASSAGGTPASSGATGQRPLSQVDVEAVMDRAVSESGQALNWRTSIVDTLKALGIDSSLEHRKALAHELNYTGDTNDSASMNTWLHKRLMQELAANGGKLPPSLTD